jgi:photosystem II stability/assembly factor-like uncharacterized protein
MACKTITGMRPRCLLPLALGSFCLGQAHILQNSHTTENLRGVSAVSADVVWASGTHSTYLRTIDGGATWKPAQVPGAENLDFRDVEAFSADEAYLLAAGPGDQSRIYKTSDAGKTWALQFTNHEPNGFYDCMAFWDRTHGIALGDPVDGKFELLTTEDGATWKPLIPATLPPAIEGEGAFAASGTCITTQGKSNVWFATGVKVARVFRSSDRGKTWAVANTPITQGTDSSGVFSISMADDKHGLIAGGDYQHPEQDGPNLAYTEDGGETWKVLDVRPQQYFSAVAYVDPSPAHGLLAIGSTHAAYTDSALRNKWLLVLNTNLNSLSVVVPVGAWAVGPKGTIVKWSLGLVNGTGRND